MVCRVDSVQLVFSTQRDPWKRLTSLMDFGNPSTTDDADGSERVQSYTARAFIQYLPARRLRLSDVHLHVCCAAGRGGWWQGGCCEY